ncbi:MAG: hypothetical protein HY231_18625 [Acidobacteria bacterium]|nr:hypothetical protein [Acidobacteriota bacterium]
MQAHNHSFKLIPFSPPPNNAASAAAALDLDLLARRQPGSILPSTRLTLVGQAPVEEVGSVFQTLVNECRDAVGVILNGLSEDEINEMLDTAFADNLNNSQLLSPCAYELADEDSIEKHFALL